MDEDTINKKRYGHLIPLLIVVSVAVVAFGLFMVKTYFNSDNVDVTNELSTTQMVSFNISNVPYVGAHNNRDTYRQTTMRNDLSAAVIAILEYWDPGNNDLEKIDRAFLKDLTLTSLRSVDNYFSNLGPYDSSIKVMKLEEASDYINEITRTPLLTSLPLIENSETANEYSPAAILTGIDYEKQLITFHHYWFGPNYQISFAKLAKLLGKDKADIEMTFVVVQPLELTSALELVKKSTVNYDAVNLSKEEETLYTNLAFGVAANLTRDREQAELYYEKAVNSSEFTEVLPPTLRSYNVALLAGIKNALGKHEEAIVLAKQSIDLMTNFDFTADYKYFGSYAYLLPNGRGTYELPHPYIALGDAYRALGDTETAQGYYDIVLEMEPGNRVLSNRKVENN